MLELHILDKFRAVRQAFNGTPSFDYEGNRRKLFDALSEEFRDKDLSLRGDWAALAARASRKMPPEGYDGEDISNPLSHLFDDLAQYHEVAAVGVILRIPPNLISALDVHLLVENPGSDLLKQIHSDRASLPVRTFSQRVYPSLQALPNFIYQKEPSLPDFRAGLSLRAPRERGSLIACFPMPLADVAV